jgi:hypothetical protein
MAVSRLAGKNSAVTRPNTPNANEATAGHWAGLETGDIKEGDADTLRDLVVD